MSLIIAARFETFDAAQSAATALMNNGVVADDLHTFFVNPAGSHDRYPLGGDRAADPGSRGAPRNAFAGAAVLGVIGAIVGALITFIAGTSTLVIVAAAGVGAYIGSLAGGVRALGHPRPQRSVQEAVESRARQGRASGVLLAVHTSPEHQRRVADILRQAGGVEVERAQGRWADGKWVDFDPLSTPVPESSHLR